MTPGLSFGTYADITEYITERAVRAWAASTRQAMPPPGPDRAAMISMWIAAGSPGAWPLHPTGAELDILTAKLISGARAATMLSRSPVRAFDDSTPQDQADARRLADTDPDPWRACNLLAQTGYEIAGLVNFQGVC